jgi:type IV secretory pathway VirB10-like protein
MENKPLKLHPLPAATTYNKIVVYGVIGAGLLIALTYLTVMSSRGNHAQWERPDRFVTLNRALVTEERIPQPPPPEPAPVVEAPPPVVAPAPPPPHPQPARPNPDIARRKAALIKALSAKISVEAFSPDKAQAQNVATIAPQQTYIRPTMGQVQPMPGQMYPGQGFTGQWAGQQPMNMGRTSQFWQQSSHANTDQYLSASVQAPRSPYQVNAGTIIPAVLAQAITSDLEGTVTALVTNDVYDSVTGRYLLIPQGSRLFGVYDADLQANQPRLQLAFKTLYFPNGYSISLEGMPGADQRGLAGLTDQVNRHFFQRYGNAAILSLITAGISMATYGNRGNFYSYEPQEAAMSGAGQVLGRAVAEDLRRSMNIRPTVTVREAYPFTMTVTQDVTFPGPYPFAGGAE